MAANQKSRSAGRRGRRKPLRQAWEVSLLAPSTREELRDELLRRVKFDEGASRFHHFEVTWVPKELALWADIRVPTERRLAESLFQARNHEVMPLAEIMGDKAVLWVAEAFREAGRHPILEASNPPQREAFASRADYEAFRKGLNFQHGFADVQDEEFDAVLDFVADAVRTSKVQLGRNLNVVSFPLGRHAGRQLPLREWHWIDEQLLELVFFWQMVHAQEVVTLPAIDPNPGAFERIFPTMTTWPADSVEARIELPVELGDEPMQEIRAAAQKYVNGLKLGREKIDGLTHLNIEKVASSGDKYLKNVIIYGRRTWSKVGVVIDEWNRWVSEQSPQFVHRGLTVRLGRIAHSGVLPSPYDVEPVDDDRETLLKRLAARRQLIQTLVSDGRTQRRDSVFASAGIKDPREYETRIVGALFGRALNRRQLAKAVGCGSPFTLHKNGLLPRLVERDIVIYDRRIGYYLRDFPPVEAIRMLKPNST
jgi:hypothetical protein